MLWPRPQSLSAIVRLVSASIPLWPRLHTLSAMCPAFVRPMSALSALVSVLCLPPDLIYTMCPPCDRLVSATCPLLAAPPNLVRLLCLPHVCASCVRHVSALCPPCARSLPAQVHHVSWPLDFVRSWPAVGQGHGITGQFPWHSLWLHKFRPLQVEKVFGVYAGIM